MGLYYPTTSFITRRWPWPLHSRARWRYSPAPGSSWSCSKTRRWGERVPAQCAAGQVGLDYVLLHQRLDAYWNNICDIRMWSIRHTVCCNSLFFRYLEANWVIWEKVWKVCQNMRRLDREGKTEDGGNAKPVNEDKAAIMIRTPGRVKKVKK